MYVVRTFDMLCNRIFAAILTYLIDKGKNIMATLTDMQAKVVELQTAQAAKLARQATKDSALQAQVVAIQTELDALKGGALTPENQAIVDKAVSDLTVVVTALNAEAV